MVGSTTGARVAGRTDASARTVLGFWARESRRKMLRRNGAGSPIRYFPLIGQELRFGNPF
jgi:hypothetical protein